MALKSHRAHVSDGTISVMEGRHGALLGVCVLDFPWKELCHTVSKSQMSVHAPHRPWQASVTFGTVLCPLPYGTNNLAISLNTQDVRTQIQVHCDSVSKDSGVGVEGGNR